MLDPNQTDDQQPLPAQPLPAQAPQLPPNATPAQVFVAHKMMGLSDLDAAMKARDALQRQADLRADMRDVAEGFTNGMSHRPKASSDAFRAQLMERANQPLADASARAQTGYAQALSDPSHPVNKAFQALAAKHLPGIAPQDLAQLTVNHADAMGGPLKMLSDYAKTSAEAGKAGAESQAVAAKTPAEVSKIQAEADRIRGLLGPEVIEKLAGAGKTDAETEKLKALIHPDVLKALADARNVRAEAAGKEAALPSAGPLAAAGVKLKEAEAGEKEAQAGKIRQDTGAQVAPGWMRTGETALQPDEVKDFRNKVESTDKIKKNVDEILGILGDKNIITNPTERARVQPRLAQITKGLAHETGQRGLPQQDIEFFGGMTGDPTKFSAANITGLSQSGERLKTLKTMADEDLQRHAATHGIQRVGGAKEPISPDDAPTGKREVVKPAAGGLKLTPGEADALRKVARDPKDPRAARAAVRLKMAGVGL